MPDKTVNIRFLKQGLLKVHAPENFDTMSQEEKIDWAAEELRKLEDKDIINAMADYYGPETNGCFAGCPMAAAIEDSEGNLIVNTEEWDAFCNGPSKIIF